MATRETDGKDSLVKRLGAWIELLLGAKHSAESGGAALLERDGSQWLKIGNSSFRSHRLNALKSIIDSSVLMSLQEQLSVQDLGVIHGVYSMGGSSTDISLLQVTLSSFG